jgi:ankyrin repeat protein
MECKWTAEAEKPSGLLITHRFRWAYCQLGKLRTVKLKTKRHIAEVLKNLPSSLDETYERMLLGIDPDYREQAVTLLKWLAYSQRPLTLAELATAAGIRLSGDHKDEVADPEDIDYESPVQILAGLVIETERAHEYGCICRDCKSGLTSIAIVDEFTYLQTSRIKPKSRLALAHFSVKEYLVSPRVLDGPAKYFHLSGSSGDDHLAQSCLAYILYYSTFGEKKSGEEHDTSAFPLLRYAARFWPLHFRRGECSETFRVLSLLDTEAAKSTWLSIDDPDSLREPNDKPPSAIYYATWLGLDALVQSLLENGADADGRGGTHGNALQTACMREDIELARMLLDGGANVNAQGGKLDSALQVACAVGCKEIVCLLLERGADVDVQGGIYGTALQAASLCGHESIVQLLLDEGANVNLQGGKFRQPLQANQHRRIVQMLVDRGADVNMPGIDDSFPLQAATASGYEETVQMLLDKGADINAQSGRYGDALRVAVNQGYEKIVEMLLDRGADINACGGIYGLALQEATNGGRERIAQLLLSRGADVDARDEIHGTALRVASKRGFVEIVQILLDAGADVDARVDLLHETPAATALLEASLQGHDEIVRSLLAGGANVHLRGWYDEAPLHVAAWEGHSTTVRILLDAGAIIAAPTPERPDSLAARTPWYWCSCAEHWDRQKQHEDHGCYEAVETLIIARASDISMLRVTEAQLARAESTGHHELVKILRERCTVTDDASSEDHGTRSADKEGNE